MKGLLLYLWQLPQNLIGVILRGFWKTYASFEYKGKTIRVNSRFPGGISLGETIFVKEYPVNDKQWAGVKHEWGHSDQSRVYGWLYLLLIGLPSLIWNIIDRVLTKVIGYEKTYRIYYSMPWEKGADKRGGVNR